MADLVKQLLLPGLLLLTQEGLVRRRWPYRTPLLRWKTPGLHRVLFNENVDFSRQLESTLAPIAQSLEQGTPFSPGQSAIHAAWARFFDALAARRFSDVGVEWWTQLLGPLAAALERAHGLRLAVMFVKHAGPIEVWQRLLQPHAITPPRQPVIVALVYECRGSLGLSAAEPAVVQVFLSNDAQLDLRQPEVPYVALRRVSGAEEFLDQIDQSKLETRAANVDYDADPDVAELPPFFLGGCITYLCTALTEARLFREASARPKNATFDVPSSATVPQPVT